MNGIKLCLFQKGKAFSPNVEAVGLQRQIVVSIDQLVDHQIVILRVAGSSPVAHPRNCGAIPIPISDILISDV